MLDSSRKRKAAAIRCTSLDVKRRQRLNGPKKLMFSLKNDSTATNGLENAEAVADSSKQSFTDDECSLDLPQLTLPPEKQECTTKSDLLTETAPNLTDSQTKSAEIKSVPKEIPFLGPPSCDRTVSVALPSSIVANAQSFELRAYLVGQIARALTVFGVDEVVIYEDSVKAVNFGAPFDVAKYLRMYQASNHHPLASPVLGNKDVSICSASSTTHSDTSKEPRLTDKPLPDDDATAETTQSSSTLFTSKSTLNDEEEEDDDSEQNFPNDLPVNIESFEDRKWSKSLHFFAMNLAYLETPQYLRRQLFTMHPNLKMAGLQNPLDAPHHMRAHEWLPFREGVVTEQQNVSARDPSVSFVDCGLPVLCKVKGSYAKGTRVTVRFDSSGGKFAKGHTKDFSSETSNRLQFEKNSFPGRRQSRAPRHKRPDEQRFLLKTVVDRRTPCRDHGIYWGYTVRAARSLREALTNCPFSNDGNYDILIGTSERGTVFDPTHFTFAQDRPRHILLVFGGLAGLEDCIEDEQSEIPLTSKPETIFHHYINVCQYQRSRTIRAEEALIITLSVLRPLLLSSER